MANITKWHLKIIQECSRSVHTDIILFKSRNKFIKSFWEFHWYILSLCILLLKNVRSNSVYNINTIYKLLVNDVNVLFTYLSLQFKIVNCKSKSTGESMSFDDSYNDLCPYIHYLKTDKLSFARISRPIFKSFLRSWYIDIFV